MLVPIEGLDRIGVVKDVQDYDLPLNAWTDSRNVRLHDGYVEKFRGQLAVFDPPTVAPYWLLHTLTSAEASVWVYAGLGKVYVTDGASHTDITRAVGGDYLATPQGLWNGGVLGGVPILNNGLDDPQYWNPPINVGTRLAVLPNWLANTKARVIRPHGNFLIAMDLTEGGSRFMHRVRISHPANPGAVPSSWDDVDPTTEAIKKDLTDVNNGKVVDGMTLGNQFLVYKEHATHAFQYIGGLFKWRNYQLFSNLGILGDNCVTSFEDQQQQQMHFVYSGEDVVVHNGLQAQSVVDRRQRRWLINNVSKTNVDRSFVVPNISENEVWLCVPLEGATFPNHAMVWNIQTNGLTQRDLDEMSFIALGRVPSASSSDSWDADTGTWDSDATPWDEFSHPTFLHRMVAARPASTKLFHLDFTEQFNGSSFEAFIERTGLPVYGIDASGKPLSDVDRGKIVRSIYPKIEGGPVEIQVGMQATKGSTISWSAPKVFTPGQRRPCVDFGISGKLWGMRFRSSGNSTWRLTGLSVDVEPLGNMG